MVEEIEPENYKTKGKNYKEFLFLAKVLLLTSPTSLLLDTSESLLILERIESHVPTKRHGVIVPTLVRVPAHIVGLLDLLGPVGGNDILRKLVPHGQECAVGEVAGSTSVLVQEKRRSFVSFLPVL